MKMLKTPEQAAQWLQENVVQGQLSVDSRQVGIKDGFIAWPGAAVDGRQFVAELLKQGVAACLVEADGINAWGWSADKRIAAYAGLKKDIAQIAALYYAEPSKELNVFAITGTNGKTSSSWWLAQALTLAGHSCGVVGTMGIGRLDALEPSSLTTPDPVRLQQALRHMQEKEVKAVAIEASSIGIAEHRFDAVQVKVALFTNLTQDHLDYHKTMQAYWQAKRELFNWPHLEAAVINVDDTYGAVLAKELEAEKQLKQIITYSASGATATLRAESIQHLTNGVEFNVVEEGQAATLKANLVGDYNIANLLGVIGAMRALGYSLKEATKVCSNLMPVPGRMQNVFALKVNECKVVVDYAHTPDALESALKALQPLAKARGGELWVLFGCGGDRDASKRPLMGSIAKAQADCVVITSDNPRSESAEEIIKQIVAGVAVDESIHIEKDRRSAIEWILAQTKTEDVVLIAGKGHENYQEINGVRYPFSDADIASQALAKKDKGNKRVSETMLTLQQAKELLESQGVIAKIHGDKEAAFSRVHSDTRTLKVGDLFVALKGENFDAHAFLVQAREQGAVAALAEYGFEEAGIAGLEVANSLKALGALAKGWRACHDLPVIAVTGSNGKTTTTQMIASILSAWQGESALATRGNFNNDIGVPLSVLRLRAEHTVAVFELGMNHPGEIQTLAEIAQPTVALVNNAQREHLEFMSTVNAVAKENGQVINALPKEGVAVLPAQDEFTALWRDFAQARSVATFAVEQGSEADYTATYKWDRNAWVLKVKTPQGNIESRLQSAGVHNVRNALAAIACAQSAGAPLNAIEKGLNAFLPVNGRSQVELLEFKEHQVTVINDTYNANPDSMLAAIDVLADLPQPTLLVLGEMGEVGEQGSEFHIEVGQYAHEKGITALWGTGELVKEAINAFGTGAQYFEDTSRVGKELLKQIEQYKSVLVKGSRYTRMERVVEQLKANSSNKGGVHAA